LKFQLLGLPDFVIQAGLPDFVIQAGLPLARWLDSGEIGELTKLVIQSIEK